MSARTQWMELVRRELGDETEKLVTPHSPGLALLPAYFEGDADEPGLPGLDDPTRGASPAGPRFDESLVASLAPASSSEPLSVLAQTSLDEGASALYVPEARTHELASLGTGDAPLELLLAEAGPQALCDAASRSRAGSVFGLYDPMTRLAERGFDERAIDESYAELASARARVSDRVRLLGARGHVALEAGAGPALELAMVLGAVAEHLRGLEPLGLSGREVLGHVTVTLGLSGEPLIDAAKLRAARRALGHLADVVEPGADVPPIVAIASRRMLARRDVHTNLLRVTNATIGALLGGADVVVPRPFDEPLGRALDASKGGPSAARLARLGAAVLREESHLGRVLDPLGGAYAIEAWTEALASEAWGIFRDVEGKGGLLAELLAGSFQARVERERLARQKRVATRKQPLVGVSIVASVDEGDLGPPPPRPVGTTLPVGAVVRVQALPQGRDAEPFEQVREVSERAARTGARPEALVLLLGPRSEHAARAAFTRGALEVGGLRVVEGTLDELGESRARVVVLAGSDEGYAAHAEAAARRVASLRPDAVLVLAGRPGPLEGTLRAAGVAHFLYLGCDVCELLGALVAHAAASAPKPTKGAAR